MNAGPTKVLVLHGEDIDERVVRALMPEQLDVVGMYDGIGHHMPAADVVVVACGSYTEEIGSLIRECAEDRPERPVVLVTQGAPNGYVDHSLQAGAADIVVLPQPCGEQIARALSQQLAFTIGKAVSRKAAPGGDGKMVTLIGPKGGSGKTLVAVNLAAALTAAGRRVVVVDLDLQFGDVGLALGLTPETTVYDLLSSGGSMDAEKVEAFLAKHESGTRALLAPRRPDQAGLVTPDFMRDVYAMLRVSHDVVIVDTPPQFTPEVIAAVDASTDVCVVAMLDALSLKNLKVGLETLELMGYPGSAIRFVLNRADSEVGIDLDDVSAITGRVPDVLVPSDRAITRSVNEGMPIALRARNSRAGQAFHQLAALYGDVPAPAARRRRLRAFARAR